MEAMVTAYLLGKKCSVPATLTIMDAMEYAGFKLIRGVGCRNGFCGACAVIYRIKGSTELKVVLACQTKIEEGMCVGKIESFPLNKRSFNLEELKPTDNIIGQLYPEIYSCIGCNACTKGCPEGLNVMQYIAYAQRGEYEKCARESFDCVGCNICASRCPAQISQRCRTFSQKADRQIPGTQMRPSGKTGGRGGTGIVPGAFDQVETYSPGRITAAV